MLFGDKVFVNSDDTVLLRSCITRLLMAGRAGRTSDMEDEADFMKEILFHAPDAYKAIPFPLDKQ